MNLSPRRAILQWRARWRELLRDADNPSRTAAACSIGTCVGLMPVLGLHTWLAIGLASLMRLPPLAALLASNISNPITFLPLTLLEVRLGSWLLGSDFAALPDRFSAAEIGHYVLEAWLGWSVLSLLGGALAYFMVLRIVESRRAPLDAGRARR